MKARRLWWLLALLLTLAGCDDHSSGASGEGWVEDGPDLSHLRLISLDGEAVSLADYRGRHLLINFWATWCAPCREEMPALQRLSEQLDPQRYAVLGVAVDRDPELVRQFIEAHGIGFRQFVDPQMSLALSELNVRAFPETLIIARDGRLQRRILGARAWDDPAYYQTILPRDKIE